MPEWILTIQIVILVLFEWNLRVYRPLSSAPMANYPFVSVLIPCRNEAPRIRANVGKLLRQDYPDYEVVVYDDDSNDGSGDILDEMAREDRRLRIIRGGALPAGWTGKNRACHELAKAARGAWLLFVDADTHHEPGMLRHSLQTAIREKASFLSTFPRQRFTSLGDELIVPLMFNILLCFLPMYFVPKKTWKWAGSFSAACGQFLLFEKSAYFAAGGHEGLKDRISEAPLLAQRVKDLGRKIILADGSAWTSCTMYGGFREAYAGFTRSIFATMGRSLKAAVFFLAFNLIIIVAPYFYFAAALPTGDPRAIVTSALGVAIPLWIRARIHTRLKMPVRLLPLHVVSVLIFSAVIVNSFFQYRVKRQAVWKERCYAEPC